MRYIGEIQKTLWTVLEKFLRLPYSGCNGNCNQGRNCVCGPEKKSVDSKTS